MSLFAKELTFIKGSVVLDFESKVNGIYLLKSGTAKVKHSLPFWILTCGLASDPQTPKATPHWAQS